MVGRASRMLFIDNLRWTAILLVISMHAADTYSPLGNWYFGDKRPLSPPELLLFAAWQMYLQAFFMGLLFFIAGLFVPASFARKGAARFVRERAIRLGLPVLFYMFVLGPLTEYFVAHSRTSTRPTSFAQEWIKHIRNGEFLQENGPLWFCLALLIFSLVYAGTRVWTGNAGGSEGEQGPPGTGKLIGFALAMAALTFAIRLARPGPVLNMHLGDFPQYILLFSAGIAAANQGWLPRLPYATGVRWVAATVAGGLVAWLAIIEKGGALVGQGRAYSGGWHWQSAAMNVWEAFTCSSVCLGLIVLYRAHFDRQGRWSRFLSANAFAVYVFHPPIVIATARLLLGAAWDPNLKFALLTAIGAAASFVLSALVFRRIPLLRAIL